MYFEIKAINSRRGLSAPHIIVGNMRPLPSPAQPWAISWNLCAGVSIPSCGFCCVWALTLWPVWIVGVRQAATLVRILNDVTYTPCISPATKLSPSRRDVFMFYAFIHTHNYVRYVHARSMNACMYTDAARDSSKYYPMMAEDRGLLWGQR